MRTRICLSSSHVYYSPLNRWAVVPSFGPARLVRARISSWYSKPFLSFCLFQRLVIWTAKWSAWSLHLAVFSACELFPVFAMRWKDLGNNCRTGQVPGCSSTNLLIGLLGVHGRVCLRRHLNVRTAVVLLYPAPPWIWWWLI